jgi:hypothetical protein
MQGCKLQIHNPNCEAFGFTTFLVELDNRDELHKNNVIENEDMIAKKYNQIIINMIII